MKPTLTKLDRDVISEVLSIPSTDVAHFKRLLSREIGLSSNALSVDNMLKSLGLGRVLYMPTYRRIEKDIHSIFPDIEERFRTRIQETQITAREDINSKEIVSFGMEDIETLIASFIISVKEYQRISTDTASQEYIRDIVRGRISTYSLKGLRDLNQEDLKDFVNPPKEAMDKEARVGRSRGRSVVELYNEIHPHSALRMRSPREFIRAQTQ
ncbi:hypothetical protein [Mesorhizobium sp. WSM2239]|uniref:Uncharacterized protein n=2 Tax=unclassified Mesorhizobium TaxID=325217 RepID=A0AAU8D8X4_9HYPH